MIGSFQAQYFKFLSVDPNTIYQFFVDADPSSAFSTPLNRGGPKPPFRPHFGHD